MSIGCFKKIRKGYAICNRSRFLHKSQLQFRMQYYYHNPFRKAEQPSRQTLCSSCICRMMKLKE